MRSTLPQKPALHKTLAGSTDHPAQELSRTVWRPPNQAIQPPRIYLKWAGTADQAANYRPIKQMAARTVTPTFRQVAGQPIPKTLGQIRNISTVRSFRGPIIRPDLAGKIIRNTPCNGLTVLYKHTFGFVVHIESSIVGKQNQ